MAIRSPYFLPAILGATALILAGCASKQAEPEPREVVANSPGGNGGLLDGLIGSVAGGGGHSGENITVNSYLWRASLDTISFLPLSTADPFGGVIITDWYSPPESPKERFKLNVYILGQTLRADGVKVSVFRQVKDANDHWTDAKVPDETGSKIEDSILTKARMLRHQTLTSQ